MILQIPVCLTYIILIPLKIPTFQSHSNEIQNKTDISTMRNYSHPAQYEKNVNEEDISKDWKQTIETLQLRLTETLNQNTEQTTLTYLLVFSMLPCTNLPRPVIFL